jgi:hypothetical protein
MKSTFKTAALLLALGLGTSTVVLAADTTGSAPGGTGVEQSTAGQGATNKQGDTTPMGKMKGGPNSMDQGGTGIKGSEAGHGATDKSTEDMGAPMGSKSGMSSGNAPGGTGVESSSQGQGAGQKD